MPLWIFLRRWKTPKMPDTALHVILRDARIAAGRSQAAVAATLGITQTALSYWENGRRAPSPTDLERWAAAVEYRVLVVPRWHTCKCGDDTLYWRGWNNCVAAAVKAMATMAPERALGDGNG